MVLTDWGYINFIIFSVCVCVCVCVRARACTYVRACAYFLLWLLVF